MLVSRFLGRSLKGLLKGLLVQKIQVIFIIILSNIKYKLNGLSNNNSIGSIHLIESLFQRLTNE